MKKLPYNHAKAIYVSLDHRRRFRRFVTSRTRPLTCQECGGSGGQVDVIEWGQGPWEECGWCRGTGYMAPHDRGLWLRFKREEKAA